MIPRLSHLGRPAFRRSFFNVQPVVITGGVRSWPAAQRWSPDLFRNEYGDTRVTMRAYHRGGPAFLQQVVTQAQPTTLRQFIDVIESPREDTYAWALRETHEILEQHPSLRDELPFESVFGQPRAPFSIYLWVGPAEYVTGFHTDEIELNLLAHLYGYKTVTLISPEYNEAMAMITDEPVEDGHYSAIDAYAPNLEQHPQFAQVEQHTVDLQPGDLLYIPAGWWHRVVSHSVSISASGMSQCF